MIRPHGFILDIMNYERMLRGVLDGSAKGDALDVICNVITACEGILESDFDGDYFTPQEVAFIKEKVEFADMLLLLDAPRVALNTFEELRRGVEGGMCLGSILVRHLRFPVRLLDEASGDAELGALYELPGLVKYQIAKELIMMV